MGFLGRCEAIKAPTTENDIVQMAKVTIASSEIKISPRVCSLRRARIRLATASATHSAHSDQAIQAAVRLLIPPTPRSCSLAPSVGGIDRGPALGGEHEAMITVEVPLAV